MSFRHFVGEEVLKQRMPPQSYLAFKEPAGCKLETSTVAAILSFCHFVKAARSVTPKQSHADDVMQRGGPLNSAWL
jgi:hypothetical protein